MRGVTQGHRGRVPAGKTGERGLSCGTVRGAILVQPGLPASISRDTFLCHLLFGNLFFRELDECSAETYQEAFTQEYARNVNN